ncbi:MAG: helix-turn-helix domain-containing protein [Lachnospiraceae bacterium]|nr:helix-turn-helix domain-containing protein [Lachnospiraceae bacterium]
MTQEELAEEMCTTKSMIAYYENDHGDIKLFYRIMLDGDRENEGIGY